MAAVGLVWAVVQLAMVSSAAAEDIYRSYLGKVACCHFSLVSNIFLPPAFYVLTGPPWLMSFYLPAKNVY